MTRPTGLPSWTTSSPEAASVDLEHAQRPVRVPAVVEAGDRLLARVAALRERDRALVEPRLGRQDRVVDLGSPARRAREDPQPLELLVGRRRLDVCVEHLDGGHAVVASRNPLGVAEDDRRGVLLRLDLALGGDPHPGQVRAHRLAELGLGEEQEVVLAAAPDEERRDHAGLRRQQQRLAASAGEHVVRHHPLEEVRAPRALHAHVGARTGVRLGGNCHRASVGAVFRSKAERKVSEAGYDPARLPPGQYLTDKWPVLHAGSVPRTDLSTWTLPRLRRGRAGARAHVGAVQRAAAQLERPGHPLRDALEPLRRAVRGRPLARAREALPPEAERASRSSTPSTSSRPTSRSRSSRTRTRCSRRMRTASR